MAIFIVFGEEVAKDFSNIKSIQTKVIPNIGEEIIFEGILYKVHRKVINYKHVEDYDLKDKDRGKEMICIFV